MACHLALGIRHNTYWYMGLDGFGIEHMLKALSFVLGHWVWNVWNKKHLSGHGEVLSKASK